MLELFKVMKERLLQKSLIIDIDGTLNMTVCVLIIESAVYDDHRMAIFFEQQIS